MHGLYRPVHVAQEWLAGVEPGCRLEVVGAVDGANRPFAVVDRRVVVGAEGDGVVDVGGAAVFPGF